MHSCVFIIANGIEVYISDQIDACVKSLAMSFTDLTRPAHFMLTVITSIVVCTESAVQ